MFLRRLTLKGFKSFADTATLDLEPGVTVVVGPNGSGKSNVVDAIAWVLGAQAPSSVRSQKMEDVIFAGTAKRPALGRAEVSLTIDNSAGLLPIDLSEVTVARTLFRNGESEYAINGVTCRLLDVQELLSDAGVGRQQHLIVSQGQIDAVLNSRPEERRMIIEEAAGVLKFRRRKEKAERRLDSTEGNLLRLGDLLREVRRQLRPLEKQADAARRYDDLATEVSALRLHLVGQDIATLRARLEDLDVERGEASLQEAELRAELKGAEAAIEEAEHRLGALGGFDLGDRLAQFEALRERARGLSAVVTERRRSTERDRGALLNAGVVATLEADAASMRTELDDVERAAVELVPQAEALADAERALAADRAELEAQWGAQWGDSPSAPDGGAAELRGELAALRASVERGAAEAERVDSRLRSLLGRAERLGAEAERLRGECAAAEATEIPLIAEQDAADAAAQAADVALREAEEHRAEAEATRATWEARAEALAQALDDARARAGAERLAEVEGVLGTLLDLVQIDDGWQPAFEAAAGDALLAVVVDGTGAARRALATLDAGGANGAVLALGASGLAAVAPPPVGARLRDHVRADRREVEQLLDVLVGSAVIVDGSWEAALDVATAHPGVVAVTANGDRFGPGAWRLGAGGDGATRAALEDARARADDAAQAARVALARVAATRAARDEAHRHQADVESRLDANDARMTAAADGLARVASELRDGETEAAALRSHRDDLLDRVSREQQRVGQLEVELPALEAAESAREDHARQLQQARSRLEERAAAVGALRTDLEVRAAGLEERRQFLTRRMAEVEERLRRDAQERVAAEARRRALEETLVALDRLAAMVATHSATIDAELDVLHEARRRQSEEARAAQGELDAARRSRAILEKRLDDGRDRLRRCEIDEAESRMRLDAALETLAREFDCQPDHAVAAPCPEIPPGETPAARALVLERELKALGPINPLALEEYTALQERHTFLEAQLEDVRTTRRELAKVIKAIDEEIVNVFSAAYADVAENFERLFETLFPGGQGRLHLTDNTNLLSTGIEVEARPSGKNVKKLSLLSGGERSLTALAFLFSVFRSRPSPFYVMDEVEAALDDVNLHRFLGLIREFRDEAQLVIVSHQKRTMEAADCLFGVTMQPGGSSKVVSERVSSSS